MTGVDAHGVVDLEWWRVVGIDDVSRRVVFVDQEAAEAFAEYLLATTTTLVVIERWRDGARIDYQVMMPPAH